MGKGRDFSKEQVMKAIEGTSGITSAIAKRLKCSWHTAEVYVNKWACTKRAYQDEVEQLLDLAETKMAEAINEGDGTMIRYILSSKGKRRGYAKEQEAI